MTIEEIPTLGLGAVMASYWIYVGVMLLRVGGRTNRLKSMVVPAQRRERLMLFVWIPVVWAWIHLPIFAVLPSLPWVPDLSAPGFIFGNPLLTILRFVALGVAVCCLMGSIHCWRYMGTNWRMAIDPGVERHLIQEGPFAFARHPIYSLSILLMLCSAMILPSAPMLVVAVLHIGLILMKVRNEEVFLRERFGPAYDEYSRQVGRFTPRPLFGPRNVPGPNESEGGGSPPGTSGTPGGPQGKRLNHFQMAMLRWEKNHPYNAMHAVRLRGAADPRRLRAAIEQTCRETGIGELALNTRGRRYVYLPLSTLPFVELPSADSTDDVIRTVADKGLNARFPATPHHPIRWHVADVPSEAAHVLVLVYHHVAADAAGVERILQRVLCRYLSVDGPSVAGAGTLLSADASTDARRPFRRYGIVRSYIRTAVLSVRVFLSRRPHPEQRGDDCTGTVLGATPDGLLARLQSRCTQIGVGVNDAFVAALASAIAHHLPPSRSRLWRPRIVLGTVLSRRPRPGAGAAADFGVCLSDVILLVRNPEGPLEEMVHEVASQTRQYKLDPPMADAISDMRLFLARWSWPFVTNSRRGYRTSFPVCGGVSTVVVNQSALGPVAPQIGRYVRACPPGPVMPLVLAPTIYGARLEFSLVYRLSCLNRASADGLLRAVVAQLDAFAGPPHEAPEGAPVRAEVRKPVPVRA